MNTTTAAKPVTPLAKEEARLTADARRGYARYDHDAAAYGVRVADYNAGFMRGWDDGAAKTAAYALAALKGLKSRLAESGSKWTEADRRGYAAVVSRLRGYVKKGKRKK